MCENLKKNPSITFCDILFTDKQTNTRTDGQMQRAEVIKHKRQNVELINGDDELQGTFTHFDSVSFCIHNCVTRDKIR